MSTKTTSSPCQLRLIPAAKVVRYAVIHQNVRIEFYSADVIDIPLTPGSFTLSDQPVEGAVVYQKRHTFRVPSSGLTQQQQLQELVHTPLVALYLDEKGRQKVSGEPLYPLTLSFQPSGGTYSCTLAGKSPSMDLFAVIPE